VESKQAAIVVTDSEEVEFATLFAVTKLPFTVISVIMDSTHFTRSKARRPSISLDTPSDVEPDDVAPEAAESGPVGFLVKVARGPESWPLQLAEPSSAPAPAEGGSGVGSGGPLLAEASLGASGDRLDPVSSHQVGQMSFQPELEYTPHQ